MPQYVYGCSPLSQFDRDLLGNPPQQIPVTAPSPLIIPGGAYAYAGSQLRYSVLTTVASVTVDFHGRLQRDDATWGSVAEQVIGTSAGGIDQVTRASGQGYYSMYTASVRTGTVSGTECYVMVELGSVIAGSFVPYAILLQGYIANNQPLSNTAGNGFNIPSSGAASSGSGCCIEATYGDSFDPDSLNPYILVPDTWDVARLVYLQYAFTTSGVAGNRRQYVALGNINVTATEIYFLIDQPASTTYGYLLQIGGTTANDTTNNLYSRDLPESLWIDGDYYVTIQASNIKAGDVWGFAGIVFLVKGA